MRNFVGYISYVFSALWTLSSCSVSIYVPCNNLASCSATTHGDSAIPTSNEITTYTGMFWPNSNSGGAATAAQPNAPTDLVFDTSGNLYFADSSNHVVRKITPAGIISTVAGNGTLGYSGDGGLATAAKLNYPFSVAVDASGNIYIADEAVNVIRKVTVATGIITTIAGQTTPGYTGDGGPATAAKLNSPYSLRFDSSQNLYIDDLQNAVIRKIAVGTGIITTVAGNGSNGYSGDGGAATSASIIPNNIAISTNGDLYISDLNDSVIRKVTAATGIISTFAGNGQAGYTGDNGAATDANVFYPSGLSFDPAGNVIFADQGNNTVREVNITTGIITTLAGDGNAAYNGDGGPATSAEVNEPESVAVDANGNVFIADTDNNVIREIKASTGDMSTFAGVPIAGYFGDGEAATSAFLSQPWGVALDSEGNLYTADFNSNAVRKTDAITGIISTVAGNGTPALSGLGGLATSAAIAQVNFIAVAPNGDLYMSTEADNTVLKVTKSTGIISAGIGQSGVGYFGDGGPATSAVMNSPAGLAVAANGNVYVCDAGNHAVRKVTAATGIITTVLGGSGGNSGDGGPATSAKTGSLSGLALDADENIYITDMQYSEVRMVSATTGIVTRIAGTGVSGYSGDGGPATSAKLNQPQSLSVDENGNIFIVDTGNQVIRKIDASTGYISTIAGTVGTIGYAGDGGNATSALFNTPTAIALGPLGDYFISDAGNRVVRKITP